MSDLDKLEATPDSRNETAGRRHKRRAWLRPVAVLALLFLLALVAASASSGDALAQAPTTPTVNGLYYGDDDYLTYWPWGYSANGSALYVYFEDPILYVALVVDREINDNVCNDQQASNSPDYTQSAGYPNHRSCKRLTDSEYASFDLRCTTAPNQWAWQQGYAGEDPGNPGTWISGTTVGGGLGDPPPAYVAGSSFAWNVNNYKTWTAPWDLYDGNGPTSPVDDWHSPINGITDVVGLDGYPPNNAQNTIPIVYSDLYQWEWPMVYEWSTDLSICGPNPAFLVAGESHHSPSKTGVINDEFDPFFDLGDLPDTYSTLLASGGPSHEFVLTDNVFMGSIRDNEADGQPELDATGDDVNDGVDDEDGVTLGGQLWTNGNTVEIYISLLGIAPSADIGMWIDWGNDGAFDCPTDFYSFTDLTVGATNTVEVTIPDANTYNVTDPVHMRVRAFDDETNAPGGSLDCTDFGGTVENGEVEDYVWPFGPTAITLRNVSADPSTGFYPLVWLGLLLLLVVTAVVLIRRGRQEEAA